MGQNNNIYSNIVVRSLKNEKLNICASPLDRPKMQKTISRTSDLDQPIWIMIIWQIIID